MSGIGSRWWLGLLAVLALGASPAAAQVDKDALQPALTPAEAWVVTNISGHVRAKIQVTELLYHLQSRFLAADLDGDGTITQKDVELSAAEQRGRARGSHFVAWASWDLDGDGRVTREEITIAHRRHTAGPIRIGDVPVMPTPAQRKEATDRFVAKAMEPDSDGDGVITFDEIRVHVNNLVALSPSPARYARDRGLPDVFDANGDGVTEPGEYTDVVTRVLARIDANGDGRISPEEAEALKALQRSALTVRPRR